MENTKNANRNRKDVNFNIGELVFIKNNLIKDKIDDRWLGPGKIMKCSEDKQTYLIMFKYKEMEVNIKRLRKFLGEGECHTVRNDNWQISNYGNSDKNLNKNKNVLKPIGREEEDRHERKG